MMRHDPQSATFHHDQIANLDVQNSFFKEEKESQLFRFFAHVSLTRDPLATVDMVPDEVWAILAPDSKSLSLKKNGSA